MNPLSARGGLADTFGPSTVDCIPHNVLYEVPYASSEINGMASIASRDKVSLNEATDLMGDDARMELFDMVWGKDVVDVGLPCRSPFVAIREESNQLLAELAAEEEPGLGGGRAARERLVMRVEERTSQGWARHHDQGPGCESKEEDGTIFRGEGREVSMPSRARHHEVWNVANKRELQRAWWKKPTSPTPPFIPCP